ncbi:MAG TPA: MarR family transcriptional regulator [Cellulomonas sp.]
MSQRRADTGRELRRLLGPLRRAVTRAVPAEEGTITLSEAQAELLRTVGRAGPLTTTALAARLHLARPTVSNLVTTLTQAGLLTREASAADLRAVLIEVTPLARQRIAAADDGRDAALQHALDGLDAADRAAIDAVLPALGRLLDRLRTGTAPGPDAGPGAGPGTDPGSSTGAGPRPGPATGGEPPAGRPSPARLTRTDRTHPREGQHP